MVPTSPLGRAFENTMWGGRIGQHTSFALWSSPFAFMEYVPNPGWQPWGEKRTLLVHSGCSAQMPQMKGLQIAEIHCSRFWRLEIPDQGSSMPGFCREAPSRLWMANFLYLHLVEGRELPGVSFIRALTPFTNVLPLWPHYLPKGPSSL